MIFKFEPRFIVDYTVFYPNISILFCVGLCEVWTDDIDPLLPSKQWRHYFGGIEEIERWWKKRW